MAVPKKRRSKSKKRIRKAIWMNKAKGQAEKALSLAKSILTGKAKGFFYEPNKDEQG